MSVPDHDVHTVLGGVAADTVPHANSAPASRQAASPPAEAGGWGGYVAGGRPEVRGRAGGEAILGAHLLHLELLASDMRTGPKKVGCPWGKCQLRGPRAGKFKLLSVTSC